MGLEGSGMFIGIVALLAVGAGGLIYAYMEYQVRMLRTTATRLAGGLLFTSKFLTVGTRIASQEVAVNAPMGRHAPDAAAADLTRLPRQEIAVVLPAVGLQFEVVAETDLEGEVTDRCTITFLSSDPAKLLLLGMPAVQAAMVVIDGVPVPVARAFQGFAVQMGLWVERVEHRIQLERDAEQRNAQNAAAAAAAAQRAAERANKPHGDYSTPVSDEDRNERIELQIKALRKAAGFKGSSFEVGADAGGKIQWFIDLDPSGRVIVQSGGRSMHGSLQGAKVTSLTGELELGLRDSMWSEDDNALANFTILAGAKSEIRLAWKERLEMLIRNLR